MASYATVEDVQKRMTRAMSPAEQTMCATLIEDASVIVDAYNSDADADKKLIVVCNMVIKKLGDGESDGIPIGATQGSMSGLGYSQSWTISNGSTGEMYLSKMDKKLLGVANRIGSYSPIEEMAVRC